MAKIKYLKDKENNVILPRTTVEAVDGAITYGDGIADDVVGIQASEVVYGGGTVKDALDGLSTYSTTEQVIGRWVDGKTLYRSCIIYNVTSTSSELNIPTNINNIDKVTNLYGMVDTPNDQGIPINIYIGSSAFQYAYYHKSYNAIYYKASWTGLTTFVLEYTKTTE